MAGNLGPINDDELKALKSAKRRKPARQTIERMKGITDETAAILPAAEGASAGIVLRLASPTNRTAGQTLGDAGKEEGSVELACRSGIRNDAVGRRGTRTRNRKVSDEAPSQLSSIGSSSLAT